MNNRPSGRQTFIPANPPTITHWASTAGKKEGEGPLKSTFDTVETETYFGQKSWELAESKMQQITLNKLAEKAGIYHTDFELICSGDLLNQCIGSSFLRR